MAGILGGERPQAPAPGRRSWAPGRIVALVTLVVVLWVVMVQVITRGHDLVWPDLGVLVGLVLLLGYAVGGVSPGRSAALGAAGGVLVLLGGFYGPILGAAFALVGTLALVTAAAGYVRARR